MNEVIRKNLMEMERLSTSIEQWYEYATNLERESKEEERLRERKESGNQEQRQRGIENNQGRVRPQLPLLQVWSRRQEM